MSIADNLRGSARDELRALRDQVNELMEERVAPALSDVRGRAESVTKRARDYAGDQAEYVGEQVRDQPLMSIGIAVAVGFLLGRLTK